MTTYTVESSTGEFLESRLTAREAMHLILTHNGYQYRVIRSAGTLGGWQLFRSVRRLNPELGPCDFRAVEYCWSILDNEEAALEEIARAVISHSVDWAQFPSAVTNEAYAVRLAASPDRAY